MKKGIFSIVLVFVLMLGIVPIYGETNSIEDNLIKRENTAEYAKVVGVIKDIRSNSSNDDIKYLDIEISSEESVVFAVSENNTYIVDKNLKVGDKVEGFYDVTKPMIMIYPPQYSVEVLRKQTDENNLFVGVFNKDYLDSTNFLKLNDIESVKVFDTNGKPCSDSIVNKKLAVFYTDTTKSIPAQTTPTKIILLESTEKGVFVNGKEVGKSYIKNGSIMLPLRAIMENLGYKVDWVGSNQSVNIDGLCSVELKSNEYVIPNSVKLVLKEQPEIINGSTYVPFQYFNVFADGVSVENSCIMFYK